MNKATEDFGWNGCIVLANPVKVIQYEVIIENNKFQPIESGAWKFVLNIGGVYGFDTYTREKVNYETIKNDILNVYNINNGYVILDEYANNYGEIIKILPSYNGLLNKSKILMKLQSVLKNDSGNFDEVLKFINI